MSPLLEVYSPELGQTIHGLLHRCSCGEDRASASFESLTLQGLHLSSS